MLECMCERAQPKAHSSQTGFSEFEWLVGDTGTVGGLQLSSCLQEMSGAGVPNMVFSQACTGLA